MNVKLLLPILLLLSCKTRYLPTHHTFPSPVDTQDLPILTQEKKLYVIDGIQASNQFDAARMNNFTKINDTTYRITILPENEPINKSPHYAFWINAPDDADIDLEIYTGDYKHRYWPKMSISDSPYEPMDSLDFDTLKAGNILTLRNLALGGEQLYIAAQELRPSSYTKNWI